MKLNLYDPRGKSHTYDPKRSVAVVLCVATLAHAPIAAGYESRHSPAGAPSAGCGNFNYDRTALGPLDYRTAAPEAIDIVETRHFTDNVERLIKGERGTIAGDIAYTLRVFPNHPRALRSAAELTRRNGGRMPMDMNYGITCWFDRAVAFRPDDAQVRVLWSMELIRNKQIDAAREQADAAASLAKGNGTIHYNVGLLYFELKDYEKSMANARIAYEQGFNLPGLRDKLMRAGKWKE